MGLEFRAIEHRFGRGSVLRGIDLDASPGEITCLLGQSGCGKTTLLRLAAGLYEVQEGEIRLRGEVLARPGLNPPPEKRPVGLVFQDGALFPHMSVEKNVGFGVSGAARATAVQPMLEQVGLGALAKAFPHTLSGGQQQRVALARALAPEPAVLLLDEPFANVDVVLRQRLREETRRLLKAQGTIALLVTHDPEEAMDIGDRIAVMADGRIVQQGTPAELYDRPCTASVAEFLGRGQRLEGTRVGEAAQTPFGRWPASAFRDGLPEASAIDVVARPEAVSVETGGALIIDDVRRLGASQKVSLRNEAGQRLSALLDRQEDLVIGASATAIPREGAVFAFPTGR